MVSRVPGRLRGVHPARYANAAPEHEGALARVGGSFRTPCNATRLTGCLSTPTFTGK